MNFIRHIVEPRKILLAWQASTGTDKKRRIVAEIIKENNDIRLEYSKHTNDYNEALNLGFSGYPGLPLEYSMHTNDYNEALNLGFSGYPGLPLTDRTHTVVMDVFAKRLPPRTRNDFKKYLNALRIPEGIDISDFALLGYSGARLPDDDFVFIHPFDTAEAPFEFMMLIPEFTYDRHADPLAIKEGKPVTFKKEGSSRNVPGIEIILEGEKFGNVEPVLLPQFHKWINNGLTINAVIERINGTIDKAKVYLFVAVTM